MPDAEAIEIKDGKLISPEVTQKISSQIEKGALSKVNAIVVHQTGGSTAESALSSYGAGGNGAHFLIDKDGTIYQTARVTQKCWHVGNIRARCKELKACSADELTALDALLFKKGESYQVRITNVSKREMGKSYPDRYPTNEDSIGIEIVGAIDPKADVYDEVSKEQNGSLKWLVAVLGSSLGFTTDDVYRHPDIAFKQPSEAKTAQWK
jgi:N-acetyl-anhydromuramyl-L-alanine amidase AmpD